MGLLLGCAPTSHPPTLSTVTPAQAYTDHPVVLRVAAGNLRPALTLDIGSDRLTTELRSVRVELLAEDAREASTGAVALETVDWDGAWDGTPDGAEDAFWAITPAGLSQGSYTVRVTDPRGHSASLAGAFVSLGPDVTPPSIAVEPPLPPDSLIFGESMRNLRIVADDEFGVVTVINWSTSDGNSDTCPFTAPPLSGAALPAGTTAPLQGLNGLRQAPLARAVCQANFDLPRVDPAGPMIVPFTFHAEARDGADHLVELDIPLRLVRRASIDKFTPTVGGLAGSQPFVLRGHDLLPGSQAFLDNVPILPLPGGLPGGELRDDKPDEPKDGVSNQSIVGLTPPRARPGLVLVQVRSPAGTVSSPYGFSYVGPPNVREVQPTVGPSSGRNRIIIKGNDLRYNAVAYIGPTRERRVPLYNSESSATDNKIVGCVPPGAGTVSVWVEDPITGEGVYPDAYTYQDSDAGTNATTIDPFCQ